MRDANLGKTEQCQHALRVMYEFLDNELPESGRCHVEKHLDECIPCLEAYEFEAELKQVISQKCRDDVPPELYARVQFQLRAEIEGNPPLGGMPI